VRPRTGRVHGRVRCRVHGRVTCRVPVTRRPCTRPMNTSSPAKTARRPTRPYNGRSVYTARTRPCMGRAHGPPTPPVYTTVYGPSSQTSSAVYVARTRLRTRDVYTAVYGSCTRPCTRHVYGREHVSTCLLVHGRVRAIYTAENGRLHCRTRPFNVSCIRPCTGRTGSCTRQCMGRVHGRFRPSTQRVHRRVTARVLGRYTAMYKGRLGRVYGR